MMRKLRLLFFGVWYASATGCCPQISMLDVPPLREATTLETFQVAHRGSLHTGFPDNSLPALKQAVLQGIKFLEVDIRRDSEGELFLFHDSRITSRNSVAPRELYGRRVQELSSEQRKHVYLDRGKNLSIPTLEQAFDVVVGTKAALQLDLKGESDSLLSEVMKVVTKRDAFNNVVIQLKSVSRMRDALESWPNLKIVARCRSMSELRQALQLPILAVELERWVTSEAIEMAHRKGILTAINIAGSRFDTLTTKKYFYSKGIDSIMTDFANQ